MSSQLELVPPEQVLRRLPFNHPRHKRYLRLPVDDPKRALYNERFWPDLLEAGLVEGPEPLAL